MAGISAVIAAGAAVYAATTWKTTLQNQRVDECLSAALDLQSIFGKLISVKQSFRAPRADDNAWRVNELLWDSWRQFNRCFVVARRYRANLREEIPKEIREQILVLEELLHGAWTPDSPGIMQSPGVSPSYS